MLLDKLNSDTMALEKTLDASWLRNEVIAHNISNVDTPTYNRKDVDFESYLQSALYGGGDDLIVNRRFQHFRMGGASNLESVHARVTEDYENLAMRIDGNNVDIDEEMAQMAKNTIKYNTVTQSISGKFTKLKTVISEGSR
jgi:flagellar basal-body rod protein FlgB